MTEPFVMSEVVESEYEKGFTAGLARHQELRQSWCESIAAHEAVIERLRKTLKEIAENTHDIEAAACAWSALMRMKPRASEQKAP